MKIGLLIVATNLYMNFLPQLLGSVRSCFLRNTRHDINAYVWTNRQLSANGITRFQQDHLPWPHTTLRRYQFFWSQQAVLRECDYLFYCDVDMTFVGPVGEEVLGDLVGTIHPGFWNKPRTAFSYETNEASTAYVPPERGEKYYAGGFNGGTASEFLAMSECLSRNIQIDLDKGIIAKHHDESHLNNYLATVKAPTVALSPSYCFPMAKWARALPFERKIVALDKNHAKMRAE